MTRHRMMDRLAPGGLATGAFVVLMGGCISTAADWPPEPAKLLTITVESTQVRPTEEFNREVVRAAASGKEWPFSPRMVVDRFAAWASERASVVVLSGPGEDPDRYQVVAINDGFTDDSVRGERLDLVLELAGDDTWRVTSAKFSRRCWDGRGHESFGTDPCS